RSIGKSKGLFHRRRVLPCRPPCATGSHLPAVLPSARPARPPGRPHAARCAPRAAGAGSQAQTARRQGWFKRLELAVAKGLRGERETGCCKGAEGRETDANTCSSQEGA